MNPNVKSYLIANHDLAKDADDATAKAKLSEVLKSGALDADKYAELLAAPAQKSPQDKLADLLDANAAKTADAVGEKLSGPLSAIADALKSFSKPADPPAPPAAEPPPPEADPEYLKQMEARLIEKLGLKDKDNAGNDGAALMKMSKDFDSDTPRNVRVKQHIEAYRHTPTALVYKSGLSKQLGLLGQPQRYKGREVNAPTERTRFLSETWLALQLWPERLSEQQKETLQWIIHKEKFHVPNRDNDTDARYLTEEERYRFIEAHKNFYAFNPGVKAAVVDDTSTGGEYATPEFFDMDMIVAPTLAEENIPSFCHIIPVPRGTAAQNFVMGRPTIAAANETTTSGTPTAVFSPTGFITNHDTEFFRAAGFIELGRNFASDAHPRIQAEIMAQYQRSVRLWLNEQICTGDGTTEPQGIMNASSTNNVTPATPTTGPATLADVMEMLFAVNKEYRNAGPSNNAIFIMTDLMYSRLRGIATGVTGDTRLVFGNDVEGYRLFNHPVLIEEGGMTNDWMIFCQMTGYRLYMRQGPRFIREDRGATLTQRNTFLIGVDCRFGGQLDLGAYAAVATGFQT